MKAHENDGETTYIYDVTYQQGAARAFTAAEDNTVRVWDTNTWARLQLLAHPDTCWSVACLTGSSDIAVACADGFAYVWSQDNTCTVQPEVLEDFDHKALAGQQPAATSSMARRLQKKRLEKVRGNKTTEEAGEGQTAEEEAAACAAADAAAAALLAELGLDDEPSKKKKTKKTEQQTNGEAKPSTKKKKKKKK